MCGRYYLKTKIERLIEKYNLDIKQKNLKEKDYQLLHKGEIFPGNKTAVITLGKKAELNFYQWGFTPSFTNSLIINARAETIDQKTLFKNAFLNSRCIIPAVSFFEWKEKNKYRISVKNTELFSLAGICAVFKDNYGKKKMKFTIITTKASQSISTIHDRMPVILDRRKEEKWLNSQLSKSLKLKNFLKPYPDNKLIIQKVAQHKGKQLSLEF